MSFLGPPKHMRFQKGKHKNGSIKAHREGGGTVLHWSICDVFWGLGGRSYTIIIRYGYQMKGYDFLHLVLVVLTLRGFAQATYRSNIKKIVVGKFKKKFQKFFLLIKMLEIEKTKSTLIISVLKVVY